MQSKKQIVVEVYFTPAILDEMQLKDKNIVVIDVLRASTTIATALKNGAKEIIPVNNIESAVKLSGSMFGDVTLRAGERNAKMIEGFNLGNSPREYTEEIVKGKSIILMTTNGSAAMVKGRHAKNLVIGSFVNLSSIVAFLHELGENFLIICAGKENDFCMEDALCAGRIINMLAKTADIEIVPDDSAKAAMALDAAFGKSILKMLKTSEHGMYLAEAGFADDLKVCADVDSIDVLPMLSGSVIRARKEPGKQIV